MSHKYIIKVSTKSNPSIKVYSHTGQVKGRLQRLKENIMASRGDEREDLRHARFDVFNGYAYNDITYKVYVDFTDVENLF